jgi:hypothetical protein
MPNSKKKAKAKKPKNVIAKQKTNSASGGTKATLVLELLARSSGVSILELCMRNGWQPHTGRAMISGLRKAGHKIETSLSKDGKTVYRIVGTKKPTAKAGR